MSVLQCGSRRLDLSRPVVMGILNVTPDSFSDGGRYLGVDAALAHARVMAGEGAALIDIGAESTRPGAAPVSVQEELDRVMPVVERIAAELDVVISLDTSTPELMSEGAARGAGFINDVRALRRPGALAAAAASGLPVCLMHMLGEPGSMQADPRYANVCAEVESFLLDRVAACEAAGIGADRIVLDQGFGFGKTLAHNLDLMAAIPRFAGLGYPLLVGVSRKSMLGALLGGGRCRPAPARGRGGGGHRRPWRGKDSSRTRCESHLRRPGGRDGAAGENMTRQYFGTDGVRGKVGEAPITPEFALKLGWAAGKVLAREGAASVVVGKDTRLSGYLLESALEAGLSAAGVSTRLLGPMPTPAIAHLTRAFHASAGIVISASHNPYYDNGIKFFGANGKKLADAVEAEIEAWIDRPLTIDAPDLLGKAMRQEDARGRYIEFCKSTFPFALSLKGLRIVLDCAHGAAYQVGPSVFTELGATVIRLACEPDGLNINRDCGSTHPESLQQAVIDHKADLGIAFDGDADRVLMVDRHGQLVDGDEIIVMIARERLARGQALGGVVGTLMSNMGMELAVRDMGLEFVRAKVGDRYVMAALEEKGWTLGGEASGHVVCLDKTTTGDAIVAALQVLAALVRTGQPLHELRRGMRKLPQHMINVRVARRSDPMAVPAVIQAVQDIERQLAGRGRVLLRASGTEPVIRVMVEAEDEAQVQSHAQALAQVVTAALV